MSRAERRVSLERQPWTLDMERKILQEIVESPVREIASAVSGASTAMLRLRALRGWNPIDECFVPKED